MSKTNDDGRAAVSAVVMQLFHQQAVTISKSGSDVVIQCENGDDANAVFDWLADIEENLWSANTQSSYTLDQRQCECCGANDIESKRSPIWNNVMLCPYCLYPLLSADLFQKNCVHSIANAETVCILQS